MTRSGSRAGSSMVEVAVSVVILAVAIPMVYSFTTSARRSWTLVELRGDLTNQIRKGIALAARGLLSAANVQISSGSTNDTVTYQKPLAVSETGTTWGAEGMVGHVRWYS